MEGQINIMNLVFEDLKEYRNFINCPDINSSNIRRFDTSPITQSTIFSWAMIGPAVN